MLAGESAPQILRLSVDGAERAFAVSAAEAAGSFGEIMIIALVDVEAQLRAAEAGALRDLMQVLSHEIMGALTPIASLSRSAAEMLEDAEPDVEGARDAVETVAQRAEGLEQFTSAYRRLARLPMPELVDVSLTKLVGDSARLFRARYESAGVALELEASAEPIFLRADPNQVSAALWALLQNAAEAALSQAPEVEPHVALSLEAHGETVRVLVEDNGPGVPVGHQESVFRPFFTTKPRGTGVGLSLARQIARAHGGDVDVLSSQERGALFFFSLPR